MNGLNDLIEDRGSDPHFGDSYDPRNPTKALGDAIDDIAREAGVNAPPSITSSPTTAPSGPISSIWATASGFFSGALAQVEKAAGKPGDIGAAAMSVARATKLSVPGDSEASNLRAQSATLQRNALLLSSMLTQNNQLLSANPDAQASIGSAAQSALAHAKAAQGLLEAAAAEVGTLQSQAVSGTPSLDAVVEHRKKVNNAQQIAGTASNELAQTLNAVRAAVSRGKDSTTTVGKGVQSFTDMAGRGVTSAASAITAAENKVAQVTGTTTETITKYMPWAVGALALIYLGPSLGQALRLIPAPPRRNDK